MKKKLFAAIAAGAMLCGMLTAPVSAAETYKKGDINMDGIVDSADAQLVLQEYTMVMVAKHDKGILSTEQYALAQVTPESLTANLLLNSYYILAYATECLADASVAEQDISDWIAKN